MTDSRETCSQKQILKAYEKPAIITFGSVSKLTLGVGGTKSDHGQGQNTKRG